MKRKRKRQLTNYLKVAWANMPLILELVKFFWNL